MTARKPAPVEERHRQKAYQMVRPMFTVNGKPAWDMAEIQRLAQAIADAERAGRIAGLREGFELGERWIGWKTADEARKELDQRICELEDGDGI